MRQRPFLIVDVFTADAYAGNPLAVVLDGEGLTTEEMQRFANWMNLSETSYLLPPTNAAADYRVRIFTPTLELPFAGHPTLGSCHAWLTSGEKPADPDHLVQECGAGLITVRPGSGRLAFAAPPLLRSGPVDEALVARVTGILGIDREDVVEAQWVDNGPGWVAVRLADADAVLAVRPGFVEEFDIGLVGMYPPGSPFAYEVRGFFPKNGVTIEDPVTGSLNASLAQWLLRSGQVTAPYVASQGTAVGRAGRAHITWDGGDSDVWVGGSTVTCVTGTVDL
jgi:PhzF family phenazine biosynthesis protein